MNYANKINGRDSDTTSNSEPTRYETLSESEYLTHEAELAKTAISRTLAEMKASLATARDVRLWTHHHPWVAVGVAAATGFSLAAVVRNGGEAKRTDPAAVSEHDHLMEEAAKAPYDRFATRRKPGISDSLLASLFNLARTAVEASLLTAIRAEGVDRAYQSGHAQSSSRSEPAAKGSAEQLVGK